jgi:hypothetical protein
MENHQENTPEPTFFIQIPTFIADDVDIDDSTAMLYGRIMSLTRKAGYCWAADKYLAELCRVSDRHIRTRLKKLKDKGYIRIETVKVGVKWDRKIYTVSTQTSFKNNSTKGSTDPFERNHSSVDIDNNNSAALAPSTQEPPTPEPQVSQAREEALKQLVLDSRALALARSPTYSDDLIINAVARVIEYNQPCNASALLTKAIQEKWKPRETSTIKPQKKELEADIISRLEALGAKRKDIAAAAFLLKRNTEDLRSQLDELKEMVDNGDPLPAPILAVLKYLAENSKK